MTAERYRRIKEVFEKATDLPALERTAFLEAMCCGDPELRREVESLLAADSQKSGVLGRGAAELAPRLFAELSATVNGSFGPYKLLREIGAGGMGVVYEAVRDDDQYRQRVAIKLIKQGMDSDLVVRRFRHERQILANLEHPNIARLLDGGVTETGQPYFVMEYITGRPIDEYCAECKLHITERLELFRNVCAAVHHAHQNLVVHRDLKPGNILVTADGSVKLLDFGIAKLLTQGADSVALTMTGMRVMTPEYASPEQLRGAAITTAGDIYSLGVVLFELLTGQRPFRFENRNLAEIERMICEQEPPRPSATITPDSSRQSGETRPAQLRRKLEGDLDNIVLMAMRKEPERRYTSAQQLGEDIRRHLAGLPVIAQRDTASYRAAKFARRHRTGVAAAALLAITLVGGILATTWQAQLAERRRKEAVGRQLAAQSERMLVSGNPVHGMLLAVEAAQHLRSIETDQALRRSLRLLPRVTTLVRSGARVMRLRFSPDGRLLATAGQDGIVRITEVATGKAAEFHSGKPVRDIAFFPDGMRLASGGDDGILRIYDRKGGEPSELPPEASITAVAVSGTGERIAAATATGEVRLLDSSNLHEIARRKIGSRVGAQGLRFTQDSGHLLVGTGSGHLLVWAASGGEEMLRMAAAATANPLSSGVNAVAVSADGRFAATAGSDRLAKVWALPAGRLVATMAHDAQVLDVALSPDGKYLLTGSVDESARLWEVPSGRQAAQMRHEGPVRNVAFSSDGLRFATGSWDGTARIWAIKGATELARTAHDSRLSDLAFSPRNPLLATAGWDGSVVLSELSAGEEKASIALPGFVVDARFSPNGRWFAAASIAGMAAITDAGTGREVTRLKLDAGGTSLVFSPDGKWFAVGSGAVEGGAGRLKIWEVGSWREAANLKLSNTALLLRFSPDSKWLAAGIGAIVGRGQGGVEIWRAGDWKHVSTMKFPEACYGIAFSPDGQWLAAGCGPVGGGAAGAVKMLRTSDWQTAATMPQKDSVITVAFSPSGEYIVMGSGPVSDGPGQALVWRTGTWQELVRLSQKDTVFSAAFSPDSRLLATGSGSAYGSGAGETQVWEIASGKRAARMPHERMIMAVAFSPDGTALATGSQDHTARVWNVANRQLLAQVAHRDALQTVAFHPSGRYLATASLDGTARIWFLRMEDLIAAACARLPRNLTREEWNEYIAGEPYRKTCPALP